MDESRRKQSSCPNGPTGGRRAVEPRLPSQPSSQPVSTHCYRCYICTQSVWALFAAASRALKGDRKSTGRPWQQQWARLCLVAFGRQLTKRDLHPTYAWLVCLERAKGRTQVKGADRDQSRWHRNRHRNCESSLGVEVTSTAALGLIRVGPVWDLN